MSKIVDYVSEDNKNDMLNDVCDSDYDAFVKLSQVFELNVFCPVHMEGEKDWVVAYLMNDAVESFLVFKDSVMTGKYIDVDEGCLLYTSPSPRDLSTCRMPSSA